MQRTDPSESTLSYAFQEVEVEEIDVAIKIDGLRAMGSKGC